MPFMNIISIISILVTFCAVFSYVNYRLVKLPPTIGIMVMSLMLSVVVLGTPAYGIDALPYIREVIEHIDFSETLLHGMLSFLLFAGAIHVDMSSLREQKYIVSIMALFGTILSTVAVGLVVFFVFPMLGFAIPLIYAFIFGAIVSPTDPIAVMAILKRAGVPTSLETKVVGESLFNDGIAVVIFMALMGILADGHATISHVGLLFIEEAVGGAVFGLVIGYIVFFMLRSVDNYQVEIFLTLALVMGGYELARFIHVSGPIAMVVSGLIIGNSGRRYAMSQQTEENLDNFWELIDEFLNAILFMLIGFNLLIIQFNQVAMFAGLFMIPTLLFIRFVSVAIPVSVMGRYKKFSRGAVPILTWGGLRGGISVALVLSLPDSVERNFLLLVTYCIVLFSILVQGLTIGKLAEYFNKK